MSANGLDRRAVNRDSHLIGSLRLPLATAVVAVVAGNARCPPLCTWLRTTPTIRSRPIASTARCDSWHLVEPACTTRMATSANDASSLASGNSSTGGVSSMTQSDTAAPALRTARIRSDTSALIGSTNAVPAVNTDQMRRHRDRQQLVDFCDQPFFEAGGVRQAEDRCTLGRRRSASTSSTLLLYDSLSVSARLTAVSVLPSPGHGTHDHDDLDRPLLAHAVERGGDLAGTARGSPGATTHPSPACRGTPG